MTGPVVTPARAGHQGLAGQEAKLLACVHCGFCLPACPTYRILGDEADSPRGRLHLMRAVSEGRLSTSDPSFRTHMDRCLGCRACEPVCPSGVRYGELLEHAREEVRGTRPAGFVTRLLLLFFGNRFMSRLVGVKSRMFRATGLPAAIARRLAGGGEEVGPVPLGLAMLAASAPSRALRKVPVVPGSGEAVPGSRDLLRRGRVGILRGCVQGELFARVGRATRRTLAANGYTVVEVEDAGCCGALHSHAGEMEAAREAARRQIRAFHEAGVDFVAVDAAGCGAAMKGYGSLLQDDAEWRAAAEDFASRVRDVSELLALAGPRPGAPVPLDAAYDPPCHLLHGQGVDAPVEAIFRAIPELEVQRVPNGDRCCGGAGIYGLTQRELGGAIAGEKTRNVLSTGAHVVLTGNPGCMMQIGAGLLLEGSSIEVAHPVELLDESYRRGGIYGPGTRDPRLGLP